jgi:hypothetical protein
MLHLPCSDALLNADCAHVCNCDCTAHLHHQWWFDVTREALVKVCEAHEMPTDGVIDPVMDDFFDDLYYEVFAGPEVCYYILYIQSLQCNAIIIT